MRNGLITEFLFCSALFLFTACSTFQPLSVQTKTGTALNDLQDAETETAVQMGAVELSAASVTNALESIQGKAPEPLKTDVKVVQGRMIVHMAEISILKGDLEKERKATAEAQKKNQQDVSITAEAIADRQKAEIDLQKVKNQRNILVGISSLLLICIGFGILLKFKILRFLC